MRTHIICLMLCTIFSLQNSAQNISMDMSKIGSMRFASDLNVLDTAQTRVFYQLDFKKDSTKNDLTTAQTVLLIGKTHTLFTDFYQMLSDSIAEDADKHKEKQAAAIGMMMNLWNHRKYEQWNICDLQNGKMTKQEKAGTTAYQYDEPTPTIDWQVLDRDTVIDGFACGTATCHYRGRDYVAWYLKDIALPFGPYVFYGLPGLVAILKDTKDNFRFTLNGLEENLPFLNYIYFSKESMFQKGSREKIRATIRSVYEHPVEVMLQDPALKIDADVANKLDRSADPYNPLELE